MAATTEEVPRPYGRGTSSVVSFVVAMNRVDVVDLVVDLVDVGLDIDLVDVDLDVDLVDVGPVDVVPAVPSRVRVGVGVVFVVFAPQKKSRGRKGTLAAGCPLDKANGRGHKSTLGKRGLSPRRNPTVLGETNDDKKICQCLSKRIDT